MKKTPRLSPLFVALSLALSAAPQAAFAQFAARSNVGAPAAIGAPVAGVSAFSAVSPLSTLAPLSGATNLAAPLAASASSANEAPVDAAARIRTPGAAATGVADEAGAYVQDDVAPAPTPVVRKGLLGRLADAIRSRSKTSAMFDGSSSRGEQAAPIFGSLGLLPQKPVFLPNGTRPDEQPTTPPSDRQATVRLQAYALPDARNLGGVLEADRQPLNADPNNVASVVGAVKALVDANPARYGINSSELRLIGARKFDGHAEQADTIFIHFRQVKDNLVVNGANLSFTLKVLDGKPSIVAQTGQVFPQIDVNTGATLTDDQIMGKIAERVGMPPADAANVFQFSSEKIIYSRGAWRHVKLYVADGLPFMIAVDLATGQVFAWDNRTNLRSDARRDTGTAVGGTISGKTVDHGPIVSGAALKTIPLGFLNLTIGGKTYTTDKDGKFSAQDLEIAPEGLALTATLSGPFVTVQDETGNTLKINVTLKPGNDGISAVFNPDSTLNDENAIAQVSAFHKVNLAYNFLRERKLTTEQMDKSPILVKTNVNDECNAYYTPGSPSLNFFKSSANCVNSAYDTVADHEYGHYWDDATGGIMNGGLSEGWGDTVSMYLLNNPVIGEHFLKQARDGVDYIRHGENTYQYNEYDEVHDQGQAWQGFTWKLRKALKLQLGDAAGAAMAEALVLPTMFAKASTIPDAMAQVLVNAMKKDGTLMHEALIRATAKIHGIVLPQNPGAPSGTTGFVAGLVERVTSPLRKAPKNYFKQEKPSAPTGPTAKQQRAGSILAGLAFGLPVFALQAYAIVTKHVAAAFIGSAVLTLALTFPETRATWRASKGKSLAKRLFETFGTAYLNVFFGTIFPANFATVWGQKKFAARIANWLHRRNP